MLLRFHSDPPHPTSRTPARIALTLSHGGEAHHTFIGVHDHHLVEMVSIPFNTPLILACALSLHGLRKRSLSPSGAAAAFFVGYTMLAVPPRTFGVALIIFYLAGSRATKVGKALKTKLEEGHQEAGYRNAAQVLCNSLSAAVAALLWSALYEANSWPSKLYEAANLSEVAAAPKLPYDFSQWCPLTPPPSASWSRPLLFVTLGCVISLSDMTTRVSATRQPRSVSFVQLLRKR